MKALLWIADGFGKRGWFRRCLAIVGIWLTYDVTRWAFGYAQDALKLKMDGIGTAAVIAAVLAVPVATLGFIFGKYQDARNDEN